MGEIQVPGSGWIAIDPTWGESERSYISDDFEHIAFSRVIETNSEGHSGILLFATQYPVEEVDYSMEIVPVRRSIFLEDLPQLHDLVSNVEYVSSTPLNEEIAKRTLSPTAATFQAALPEIIKYTLLAILLVPVFIVVYIYWFTVVSPSQQIGICVLFIDTNIIYSRHSANNWIYTGIYSLSKNGDIRTVST